MDIYDQTEDPRRKKKAAKTMKSLACKHRCTVSDMRAKVCPSVGTTSPVQSEPEQMEISADPVFPRIDSKEYEKFVDFHLAKSPCRNSVPDADEDGIMELDINTSEMKIFLQSP